MRGQSGAGQSPGCWPPWPRAALCRARAAQERSRGLVGGGRTLSLLVITRARDRYRHAATIPDGSAALAGDNERQHKTHTVYAVYVCSTTTSIFTPCSRDSDFHGAWRLAAQRLRIRPTCLCRRVTFCRGRRRGTPSTQSSRCASPAAATRAGRRSRRCRPGPTRARRRTSPSSSL